MCGIAAVVRCQVTAPDSAWGLSWSSHELRSALPTQMDLEDVLRRRGPDMIGKKTLVLEGAHGGVTIDLLGTSLCLRGPPTRQPIATEGSNDLLLFNGEIFGGRVKVATDGNDGQALLEALASNGGNVLAVVDAIKGPWSILYWHAARKRLYFGRDTIGRRSLLMKVAEGVGFLVVSTALRDEDLRKGLKEIPPSALLFAQFTSRSVEFGAVHRSLPKYSRLLHCSTHRDAPRYAFATHLVDFGAQSYDSISSMSLAWAAKRFLVSFQLSLSRRLTCNSASGSTARFAVLFSGGLDSLFLARVLDMTLPPDETFELVNVAFGVDKAACGACPDRRTAIQGYAELMSASSSGRKINLALVDVCPEEADEIFQCHVAALIYPCAQPMDVSIGTALWAAARGKGYLYAKHACCPYRLHAKVLFSGLGVDEMMGGYKGRHRTKYRIGGRSALIEELEKDVAALWWRNLGRDDRLVSDHGRELRHPFLDEDLVRFVMSLPVELVCNLDLEDGVGDKLLLRTAASLVGFSKETCARSKRAIQFGSRSKQVLERKR